MFFRRKKPSNDELHQPVMDKDGNLYVEDGQEYDQNKYETDSDYADDSSEEEDSIEEESDDDEYEEAEEERDDYEQEQEQVIVEGELEGIKSYDENEELIPWDDSDSVDNNDHKENIHLNEELVKEDDGVYEEKKMEENPTNGINEAKAYYATGNCNHQEKSRISEQTMNEKTPPAKDTTNDAIDAIDAIDDTIDQEKIALISKDQMSQPAAQSNDGVHENGHNNDIEEEEEEEEEDEDEQPSTSIHEKKSLLALAAQHDRVDIIKTILQESTKIHNSDQLIQLLLNNKIIVGNHGNKVNATKNSSAVFTKDDIDPVFLPPLHIAVASSSTNAASCLLRMGSDPSIRTIIPMEWDGPTWDDPTSANSNNNRKKKDEAIQHWRKLSGLSAWEVAFGGCTAISSTSSSQQSTGGGSEKSNDASEKKRPWFGGWSSSNNADLSSDRTGPSFDIPPSKLEGIKHAFTAEALRAIGSDEVHRLRELIESGLYTPSPSLALPSSVQKDGKGESSSSKRGVEIGGKDLLSWCVEMNAEKCTAMLKEKYVEGSPASSSGTEKEDANTNGHTAKEMRETPNGAETKFSLEDSPSLIIDDREISEEHLIALKIKLEENKVLAVSLSLVLDNLAEEVSLTQGLLYQGDNSNTALISQVRSLKETRGDVEMEISDWEGRLADRIVELRMVLSWWKKKGGSESDFIEIFDSGISSTDTALIDQMTIVPTPTIASENIDDYQSLRSKVMEMTAQVSLIEGKVKKLRASIADLAEENSRNLIEVTKMGLGGAVNLARKLKEEVKEREHMLQNLQQREAACRTRVCMIRSKLEKASAKVTVANDTPATSGGGGIGNETNVQDESEGEHEASSGNDGVIEEEHKDDEGHNETAQEGGAIYYDEEEDCIIEYVDDSDGSDVEYEYYTDDEHDGIPLSEAIKTGNSTVLALKGEEHEFVSLKLWELFLRVVGLSKQAVKETVKATGLDDFNKLTGAMIV